jgi:hypothetical protein
MEAIQRSLSKVPAGRFPTILDFTSALASGFGASSTTRSSAASTAVRPSTPQTAVLVVDGGTRRFTLKRVLGGAIVLVVAVAAGLIVIQPSWLSPLLERTRSTVENVLPGERRDGGAQLEWETLDPIVPAQPSQPEGLPSVAGQAAPTGAEAPAAQVAPQPSAVPAAGRLFVNARPWGRLFVDDEFIGNTPQPDLTLRPGTHLIRVVRDGYAPFEREIRIAAGDVVRLTDIVLEPLEE